MMIFRNDKDAPQPSPEQLQEMLKDWDNWLGGIAAQGRLVSSDALGFQGKTFDSKGVVSDGPYAEVKEIVGGYTMVKAKDFDEAVTLSKGCPMFDVGGTVEVRDIMVFE